MKALSISLHFSAALLLWPLWNWEEQAWKLWALLCPFRRHCQPVNHGRREELLSLIPVQETGWGFPGQREVLEWGGEREKCINLPALERNSWKGSRANDFLCGPCSTPWVCRTRCVKCCSQDASGAGEPRKNFESCHFYFSTLLLQTQSRIFAVYYFNKNSTNKLSPF